MITLKNTIIPAWHFIKSNGSLRHSHHQDEKNIDKVIPGEILSIPPSKPLDMCVTGLHASLHALDAFKYLSTSKICRVEVANEIIFEKDKLCARERKVLWIADLTTILPKFRDYLIEIVFKALCRATKRKDPFKMKRFSFLKKMQEGKRMVHHDIYNYKYRYGHMVYLLIDLYGYVGTNYTPNINMYVLEDAVKEIIYLSTYRITYDQLNAKFEELIYSAPRIYAKI